MEILGAAAESTAGLCNTEQPALRSSGITNFDVIVGSHGEAPWNNINEKNT